jgi:hypothetical protein
VLSNAIIATVNKETDCHAQAMASIAWGWLRPCLFMKASCARKIGATKSHQVVLGVVWFNGYLVNGKG